MGQSRIVLFLLMGVSVLAGAEAPPVEIWVSDERNGVVVLTDGITGSMVARVAVGTRPRGLRLTPDGTMLFVATSGTPAVKPGAPREEARAADPSADGIAVVDTRARRLVRSLPGGSDPEAFDLSPDGRTIFVSNEDADTLSAVDVETARVSWSVQVGGEPEGVAVRPDGQVVYVTCEGDDSVMAVDVRKRAVVARIPTPSRPRGVVFSSDGQRAWVTAEMSRRVYRVDARVHRVTGSALLGRGALPMGLVLASDERTVAVSTGRGGGVVLLDAASLTVRSQIHGVGPRVWGLGRARDGRLFAAAGPSGELVELDSSVRRVLRRIQIEGSPWGVAVWSPVNAFHPANVEFQSR